MITGFNTDVDYNGKVYHVQTEDKGLENPYIESLIYMGGAIIFSKRIDYEEKLVQGIAEKEIKALMENQHRTLIAAIKRGRMAKKPASKAETPSGEEAAETMEVELPFGEIDTQEGKTLDEVILDYLSVAQEEEQLDIVVPDSMDFRSGQKVDQTLKIVTSFSEKPVPNVPVEVRIMTTFLNKPIDAFSGLTDAEGKVRLLFSIPAFTQGAAAVVILARSKEFGNAEFKKLVMKGGKGS